MFKIGEFSKMAQVPVPTLRYYDQIGLLKPISVDDGSGYRFYSASQLPRLHRIVALKGLGFSLEQIGAVLDEGLTPDQLRGMLRLRHAQISVQIDDMQNQLRDVRQRLEQIEREAQLSAYEVVLKQVEPVLVAMVRATLPSHDSVGALFGEVYAAIGDKVSEAISPTPGVGGQTMVLWYDTEYKDQNVDGASAFVLRTRVPERGRMRVHELPACTMAATVHHGTYDTIGDAHEAVLTWVEANGYIIAGPDREVYLYNAPPIRRDDPSYVTEIQYPVVKGVHINRGHFVSSRSTGDSSMTVKTTDPKVETRAAQHYAAIRTQVAHTDFDRIIPQCLDEVMAWLDQNGIQPDGPPLMRYHVIDMASRMDVAIGWPVASAVTGTDRITAGTLPAGQYASLIYTDVTKGIAGNAALIGWAQEQGLQWDRWDDPNGDAFGGRVEFFLTGPEDDPDPANWDTEVAIKIKDA